MATAATITTDPGNPNTIKVAVAAGDTSPPIQCSRETVVAMIPGSGGTGLVQATWSLWSEVVAGTATWFDWDAGTVSAKANQQLLNATAVRFTATTAAGVGQVAR